MHDDLDRMRALFDDDDLRHFDGLPDLVHSQISRIVRSVATRHHAGGVRAPPPIVSRIFQERSHGSSRT